MDFRNNSTAIANPAGGHSPTIGAKAQQWGEFQDDILYYLSNVGNAEAFADAANNAETMAQYIEPFMANAETYLESLAQIAQGQKDWAQLRAQYGKKNADAIASIRKIEAKFESDLSKVDAKDRADLTKIKSARENGLKEIAAGLAVDLQAEAWRHSNTLSSISQRNAVSAQRQQLQQRLSVQRSALLGRVRNGSPNAQLSGQIPVILNQGAPASSVSASGTPRSNRSLFGGLWNLLAG